MSDPVSDFLTRRHSVRDFLPTPVSADVVAQLLDDALSAPSWSNTRPYQVAIATGEVKDAISAELHEHFEAVRALRYGSWGQKLRAVVSGKAWPRSDFRVPLKNPADLQPRRVALAKKLFSHQQIARDDISGRMDEIGRNFDFFGAPVVLFVFARRGMGVYSPLDAGFFLQNLALSATHRGLGTCFQGFLAVWSPPVRKNFVVPRGYKLLCGVSLGYPSDAHVNTFVPPGTPVADIVMTPGQKGPRS